MFHLHDLLQAMAILALVSFFAFVITVLVMAAYRPIVRSRSLALIYATFVFALAVLVGAAAYAQTAGDVVAAVCSPDGQQIIIYVVGTIAGTGLLTFLEKGIARLPAPVQHLLNFALGNWRQILVGLGVLKA